MERKESVNDLWTICVNTHSRKQQSNNQPTNQPNNQPTKQVNSVVAPAVAARGLLQTVVSGPTLLLLGGR